MDLDLLTWIKALLSHNNTKAFYNSKHWKKAKKEILDEQNHECQWCKAKGLAESTETVHHIKYLRKHPELALTMSNLVAVCEECHYDEHHRKAKEPLNAERW